MSIPFNQNLGICADALLSLTIQDNEDDDRAMSRFVNPKRRAADIRYFRDVMRSFETPPKELRPIFALNGEKSYALCRLLPQIVQTGVFTAECVTAAVPDAQTLALDVVRFYLPQFDTMPEIENLARSVVTLDADENIKYYLLALCLSPQEGYEALCSAVSRRFKELKPLYAEGKAKIRQVRDRLDEKKIIASLREQTDVSGASPEAFTVGVTLLAHNTALLIPSNSCALLLGSEFESSVKTGADNVKPDIVLMGKALGEEKRIAVLRMLASEEEITSLTLQRRLKLSMTATHYHLELLQQAGMLNTRNEGRTIYYSLNRDFFALAPALLAEFGPVTDEPAKK